MTTSAPSRARRGLNVSLFQIAIVLGLIVGVSIILDVKQRIQAAQLIIAEAERLQGEVDVLDEEQAALRATLAYVESDAYVEDWAHSEGQLVRPGEVLVIPVTEPGPLATPAPVTPPTIERDETWELWLGLFFEK